MYMHASTRTDIHSVLRSERARPQETTHQVSPSTGDFGKDKTLRTENRWLVARAGVRKETGSGHEGTLWRAGDALSLDSGGGYTHLSHTFSCVKIISQLKKIIFNHITRVMGDLCHPRSLRKRCTVPGENCSPPPIGQGFFWLPASPFTSWVELEDSHL